jgi:hypothetical protein
LRIPVPIDRRQVDDPKLEFSNGFLRSSQPGVWYHEKQLISPDTLDTLIPKQEGLYELATYTGGCNLGSAINVKFTDTEKLAVAPVPFCDVITIRLNDTSENISRYEVISVGGVLAISGEATGQEVTEVTLSTSGLKNGIYVARIYSGSGIFCIKIVK